MTGMKTIGTKEQVTIAYRRKSWEKTACSHTQSAFIHFNCAEKRLFCQGVALMYVQKYCQSFPMFVLLEAKLPT